ncbi:MAG: coenzyme F420-0:L-glutamate ligase, partial [Nitrososphaeraceae archaeon]
MIFHADCVDGGERKGGNNDNDNSNDTIQIIPLRLSADIRPNDELDALILRSLEQRQEQIFDNDVLVVAHKIVSKAEGRVVNLEHIKPSV